VVGLNDHEGDAVETTRPATPFGHVGECRNPRGLAVFPDHPEQAGGHRSVLGEGASSRRFTTQTPVASTPLTTPIRDRYSRTPRVIRVSELSKMKIVFRRMIYSHLVR